MFSLFCSSSLFPASHVKYLQYLYCRIITHFKKLSSHIYLELFLVLSKIGGFLLTLGELLKELAQSSLGQFWICLNVNKPGLLKHRVSTEKTNTKKLLITMNSTPISILININMYLHFIYLVYCYILLNRLM